MEPPKVDEPHSVARKDSKQTSHHTSQDSSRHLSDNDDDYDPEASMPYNIPQPSNHPPLELDKLLSAIGSLHNAPTRTNDELDTPLTPEEEAKYQGFLATEQEYIRLDQWDRFPYGSRMFLGNLPTEKITKRQLFKIFYKYGGLAQISIKQAYGFVQYFDPAHCAAAMNAESGTPLKGNRLQLEISKPQVPRSHRHSRRRSTSPYRLAKRGTRHHHHHHHHQQPHRHGPEGVPEVQIFVLDRLRREFIHPVENSFKRTGATTRVEEISSASLGTAIEQMALRGALAVVVLNRQSLDTGRLDLRLFDRSGARVRYDEYAHIDVDTALELFNQIKGTPQEGTSSQQDQSAEQVQSIMDQIARLQQSP